jgi:hypothetical protein
LTVTTRQNLLIVTTGSDLGFKDCGKEFHDENIIADRTRKPAISNPQVDIANLHKTNYKPMTVTRGSDVVDLPISLGV